ncbi:septum formation family protein [Phytoactinopolyspora endophytica]|uniref:septum formation family protein n=1 Tax=Phytoactinopolyspora endophytica TaxID=1642495 RepID=UPI00101BAD59|nr:septum formation family protein [Phytoactinopolyspora endophytica]
MARSTRTVAVARVAVVSATLALALTGCSAVSDLFGDDDESEDVERDEDTDDVTETVENAGIFNIQIGDCIGSFESDDDGMVETVDMFPCDQEYEQQIFLITEIAGDELPDDDTLEQQVVDECVPAFEEFVGSEYSDTSLRINYLSPSPESWSDDDRDIVCTAYDPEGAVTGTLEGSER